MKAHERKVFAAVALLALGGFVSGCGGDGGERTGNHQIWFMGSIFNGAMGEVLTDYQISLVYGKTTVQGTVDATTGRYTLGPLPAWNDYGVVVSKGGFRAFASYNAGISPPAPPPSSQASDVYHANTTQTFNFDAYLFPDSLQPAGVTISIAKPDPTAPPAAGSIRLRPITLPSIQDQPAGVGTQVWSNDQDLLAATISRDFTDGSIMIEGSALVYGVNYQVAVYNVEGFQPFVTATNTGVRAGSQVSFMVALTTTAAPLTMISNTIANCRAVGASTTVTSTAQITFTFSAGIEDATASLGGGAEALDNGLTASTAMFSPLRTSASTDVRERGTSFVISGNQLMFSWNASVAFQTQLAGDTLTSVSYGNLGAISLRPAGQQTLARTLSSMLPSGQTSIPCL